MNRSKNALVAVMVLFTATAVPAFAAAEKNQDMQQQIAALTQRIQELEAQVRQQQSSVADDPGPAVTDQSPGTSADWPDFWADPWVQMDRMQRQFGRMFAHNGSLGGARGSMGDFFQPSIDVQETPKWYVYSFDLPGMEKSQINIEVRDGQLIVSGSRQSSQDQAQSRYFQQERSFGSFTRVVSLPPDAKSDGVGAEYENGVLTIRVPRAPATSGSVQKVPVR